MTFLVWVLFIWSIKIVLGEIDRLIQIRFFGADYKERKMGNTSWIIVPIVSLLLPGAGQYINRQYLKALFTFAWPMAFLAFVPRPWQMTLIPMRTILITWWALAVLDAIVIAFGSSIINSYLDKKRLEAEGQKNRARVTDLGDFLQERTKPSN